jgi:hypothetical protein
MLKIGMATIIACGVDASVDYYVIAFSWPPSIRVSNIFTHTQATAGTAVLARMYLLNQSTNPL